ncbi:MAG: hypothetical protein NT126_04095 [Bacteroidetes bacterium]|nr:hypothetical protein [Bacteroidota bacterium]
MREKSIVTILFLLFSLKTASGQTVLLSVDRERDSIPPERGPNLKKFSHLFLNAGFVAGPDNPGARIIYGTSVEFGAGARKKYKLSPLYSMGWEIGMNGKIFKQKQSEGKIFPDTILNRVERMEFSSVYISFFNRINFDVHRGNFMGTFLDIGIRGHINVLVTHLTKNDLPDGSKITSAMTNLPYTRDLFSDVFVRVGKNHFSLYASYRTSGMLRTVYHYPEPPAFTIGMDAGVFWN